MRCDALHSDPRGEGEVWVRGVCDIPKHLHDLCVLLAIFFEGELTLLVVVLVLSTSSVLSSLSLILRHVVLLSTLFAGGEGFDGMWLVMDLVVECLLLLKLNENNRGGSGREATSTEWEFVLAGLVLWTVVGSGVVVSVGRSAVITNWFPGCLRCASFWVKELPP